MPAGDYRLFHDVGCGLGGVARLARGIHALLDAEQEFTQRLRARLPCLDQVHRLAVDLGALLAVGGFVQQDGRRGALGEVWRDEEGQAGSGVEEALDVAVLAEMHIHDFHVGIIEDDIVEAATLAVPTHSVEVLHAGDAGRL